MSEFGVSEGHHSSGHSLLQQEGGGDVGDGGALRVLSEKRTVRTPVAPLRPERDLWVVAAVISAEPQLSHALCARPPLAVQEAFDAEMKLPYFTSTHTIDMRETVLQPSLPSCRGPSSASRTRANVDVWARDFGSWIHRPQDPLAPPYPPPWAPETDVHIWVVSSILEATLLEETIRRLLAVRTRHLLRNIKRRLEPSQAAEIPYNHQEGGGADATIHDGGGDDVHPGAGGGCPSSSSLIVPDLDVVTADGVGWGTAQNPDDPLGSMYIIVNRPNSLLGVGDSESAQRSKKHAHDADEEAVAGHVERVAAIVRELGSYFGASTCPSNSHPVGAPGPFGDSDDDNGDEAVACRAWIDGIDTDDDDDGNDNETPAGCREESLGVKGISKLRLLPGQNVFSFDVADAAVVGDFWTYVARRQAVRWLNARWLWLSAAQRRRSQKAQRWRVVAAHEVDGNRASGEESDEPHPADGGGGGGGLRPSSVSARSSSGPWQELSASADSFGEASDVARRNIGTADPGAPLPQGSVDTAALVDPPLAHGVADPPQHHQERPSPTNDVPSPDESRMVSTVPRRSPRLDRPDRSPERCAVEQQLDPPNASNTLSSVSAKIIVLGPVSSGKTSLIRGFLEGRSCFAGGYKATIGADFQSRDVTVPIRRRKTSSTPTPTTTGMETAGANEHDTAAATGTPHPHGDASAARRSSSPTTPSPSVCSPLPPSSASSYSYCQFKAHIWDTSGEERFAAITSTMCRGTDAVVVVCDASQPQSFEDAAIALQRCLHSCTPKVVVVAANKSDLIVPFSPAVSTSGDGPSSPPHGPPGAPPCLGDVIQWLQRSYAASTAPPTAKSSPASEKSNGFRFFSGSRKNIAGASASSAASVTVASSHLPSLADAAKCDDSMAYRPWEPAFAVSDFVSEPARPNPPTAVTKAETHPTMEGASPPQLHHVEGTRCLILSAADPAHSRALFHFVFTALATHAVEEDARQRLTRDRSSTTHSFMATAASTTRNSVSFNVDATRRKKQLATTGGCPC